MVSTNTARRHNISPRPAFEVGQWPGRPKKRVPLPCDPRRAPLAASALEPAGLGGPAFFIQKQLCQGLPPAREGFPHPCRHRKATFGQGSGLLSLGNHLLPLQGPEGLPVGREKAEDQGLCLFSTGFKSHFSPTCEDCSCPEMPP